MKRWAITLILLVLLCGIARAEIANAGDLPLPIGEPNPASSWLFSGQSYLYNLVEHEGVWNADSMVNVTFEPCCRTDWHSHAGGQILIAVGGIGIHQVEDQPPELLLPGTVARVEPGVMHWHGSAGGWFQHIAVETNPDMTGFAKGDRITDEVYNAAVAEAEANHNDD